jgi:hypothetical protein
MTVSGIKLPCSGRRFVDKFVEKLDCRFLGVLCENTKQMHFFNRENIHEENIKEAHLDNGPSA